jgi:hypothetical protein
MIQGFQKNPKGSLKTKGFAFINIYKHFINYFITKNEIILFQNDSKNILQIGHSINQWPTNFHDFWINKIIIKNHGRCIFQLKIVFLNHTKTMWNASFIFFLGNISNGMATQKFSEFLNLYLNLYEFWKIGHYSNIWNWINNLKRKNRLRTQSGPIRPNTVHRPAHYGLLRPALAIL